MAVRAVVVEDDPFLLEAICDFLEGCGVDVVLRAQDAAAAMRAMAGLGPDVVILGSATTIGCGPDPARTITESFPTTSFVTLEVPGQEHAPGQSAFSGVRAIQLDGDPAQFIQAVRQVGAKSQYRLTWS